jgi:CheY-like chemotaxis protein
MVKMTGRQIFIVEDEAVNALFLKTLLEKNHTISGIAANGIDAIRQINEKKPDLIIMDIRLEGELSGIDVINEIQKGGQVDHIYCTAYTDEELIEDAMKTGPLKIIIKPVDISELRKIIG